MKEERRHWDGLKLRRLLIDLGLALVVAAVLVIGSQQELRHLPGTLPLDPSALVLLAGSGLVLVARRLLPLATYVASLGFTWLYLLPGHPPGPIYVAPFIALLTLVSVSRTVVWAKWAIVGAAFLAVAHVGTGGTGLSAAIWAAVWLLPTGLFALSLMIRRRFVAEARARADLAKRNEAAEGRRRTAEERLSIAREMHDVVGHSLAVISLQAGVAERLLETRPDEVRKCAAPTREVAVDAPVYVARVFLRGMGRSKAQRRALTRQLERASSTSAARSLTANDLRRVSWRLLQLALNRVAGEADNSELLAWPIDVDQSFCQPSLLQCQDSCSPVKTGSITAIGPRRWT
jgi:hypothetical protein